MLIKLPANQINQIFDEHQNVVRYFTLFPDTILTHLIEFVVRNSKFVNGQLVVPPPIVIKHELPSDHLRSALRERYAQFNERSVPRFNVLINELVDLYTYCYKEIFLGVRNLIVSMGINALPQLFEYRFIIEYVDDGYYVIRVDKANTPVFHPPYRWREYYHAPARNS